MGSEEDWDIATDGSARTPLTSWAMTYVVNEGDGAFYGPKLDFHLADCIGPYLAVRHHSAGLSSCPSALSWSTPARTARSTAPS